VTTDAAAEDLKGAHLAPELAIQTVLVHSSMPHDT
jgi:hypothetical protein